MEIWIAVIAVLGTLAGASIAPVVTALGKAGARRTKAEADRAQAAVRFGLALLDFARYFEEAGYDGPTVRKHRDAAYRARIELGTYLRAGDGRVDDFTLYAVEHIGHQKDPSERVRLANHCARRVGEWARGELKPKELMPFRMFGRDLDRRLVERDWAEIE